MFYAIIYFMASQAVQGNPSMQFWSFLSNHGAVLLLLATTPRITATQIGARLGITERPVRRIIAELEAAGYISKSREGRRNRYQVNAVLPLPGPVIRDLAVGDLLNILRVHSAGEEK